MRTFVKLIILISLMYLFGCDRNNIPSNSDNLKNFQKELDKLEMNITELKKTNETLKQDIIELRVVNLKIALKKIDQSLAIFTPDSKGFGVVSTEKGIFLIGLKEIQQYANGYKLIFEIGNPASIIYYHTKITVTYGRGDKDYPTLNLLTSKKYETLIEDELLPSYWNDITIILSPAKMEDLEYIWVTIDPQSVKLKTKNPVVQ